MRVRMRVRMTGSRNGEDWPDVGGLLDVSEDEGNALIQAGIARAAGLDEETETGPTVDEATGRATAPVEAALAPGGEETAASSTEPVRSKAARRTAAPSAPGPRGPANEPGG